MGNENLSNENQLTNCIKRKSFIGIYKTYEQYDDRGNIIYYYKQVPKERGEKFIIYNIDEREIGSIEVEYNLCERRYILINGNNQIINSIQMINNCCSTNYDFFDANDNIESIIIVKGDNLFGTIIEEFDKYNTRINWANFYLCKQNYYCERDINGRILKYKKLPREIIKIYDESDMEINLSNKTLVNNGFTKIQIILILQLFFASED